MLRDAARMMARDGDSRLWNAIRKFTESVPQAVRDFVKEQYGDVSEDELLDEIFAFGLCEGSAEKTRAFLRGRGLYGSGAADWYRRAWDAVKDLWRKVRELFGGRYADMGVLESYERMSAEEIGEALRGLLMGGKEIKRGSHSKGGKRVGAAAGSAVRVPHSEESSAYGLLQNPAAKLQLDEKRTKDLASKLRKELNTGSLAERYSGGLGKIVGKIKKTLGLLPQGSWNSFYQEYETPNGTLTIRIGDHQTTEERFVGHNNSDYNVNLVMGKNADAIVVGFTPRESGVYSEVVYPTSEFDDARRGQTVREILQGVLHALETGEFRKGERGVLTVRQVPRARFMFIGEQGARNNELNEEERNIVERAKKDRTYMKAPNGRPTKLTEKQWAQVRTKAFKSWFGDWEIAAKVKAIKGVSPISLDKQHPMSQKEAEATVEKLENGVNKHDGREVTWVKSSIGKILRHKGFDASILVPKLKEVYDESIPLLSESEEHKEGHKSHPNFRGYHHYVGKVNYDGTEYYVRFTIQELNTHKQDFVPNQLHSTFVSEVKIYSANTRVNTGNTPATTNISTTTDAKLAQFFEKATIASENSSKVVDENGEPLVVYHGSQAPGFTQFHTEGGTHYKRSKKTGAWFSSDRAIAYYYTTKQDYDQAKDVDFSIPDNERRPWDGSVYPTFLNLKNPYVVDGHGDSFDEIILNGRKRTTDSIARAVRRGDFGQGYDSVIFKNVYDLEEGTQMVAFSPNQIKSATDNNGDFSTEDDIRFRLGDGPYTDAEVSYENDPRAKFVGRPVRTKKQQAEFAARERRRMLDTARELAKKLGIASEVEIRQDASGLTGRMASAKGWFDPKTGKIVIITSNHTSAEDIAATILHEGVAHYGLRKLFGPHFDTFLDNVYRNAEEGIRRKIAAMAARNGWNFRTATEEYLASLAEDTNFEHVGYSWWSKIKRFFIDMLHDLGLPGFEGREPLTDNELRYILWRSYRNLTTDGGRNGLFGVAEDIAMQHRLQVGNYAPQTDNGGRVAESGEGDKENTDRNRATNSKTKRGGTVVPVGEAAKIRKGLESLAKEYDNAPNKTHGLITNIGIELGIHTKNASDYKTFELPNGDIVTIRLSNHNSVASNFGNNGLSIVFGRGRNRGLREAGESEVVEFFYSDKELNRMDGHPIPAIIRDISHFLATGEYRGTVPSTYVNSTFTDTDGTRKTRVETWEEYQNRLEEDRQDSSGLLFRSTIEEPEDGVARDYYERRVREPNRGGSVKRGENLMWRLHKEYIDSMSALQAFTDGVLKETGGALSSGEDAYKAENAMSSKNKAQTEVYDRDFFAPLLDAVDGFADRIL